MILNNPQITKARSERGFLTGNRNKNKFISSFNRSVNTFATLQKLGSPLNPAWVTGFGDGEGSFSISIVQDKTHKIGWQVQLCFKMGLHEKDKPLLEEIKNFWDAGIVSRDGPQSFNIRIRSIEDLKKIIKHFDQYPLITQKQADFELFKDAFSIVKKKQHLTKDGLGKIVAIKEAMNLGLSDLLKSSFPDITRVERPLVKNTKIYDPQWLAGFTTAEGCFMINILASKNNKLGFQVRLSFQLTQHSRDELLMRSLVEFFNCGNIYSRETAGKAAIDYRVLKLDNITEIIIPFFKQNPILGVKSLDFADWCKAADLIKQKAHLTKEGLDQIREIKADMNRDRENHQIKKTLSPTCLRTTPSSNTIFSVNKRHFSSVYNFNRKDDLKADQMKINKWLSVLINLYGQLKKGLSSFKIVMHINYNALQYPRSKNFKSGIIEFSWFCMSVGISEELNNSSHLIVNNAQYYLNSVWNFSLRNSNNFFNSFVKRHRMKTLNQLRYSHNLSNEEIKNNFALGNNTNELNPNYVTGFTDGEGCFLINVRPKPNRKNGYGVELSYRINLHLRDRELLLRIQNFFCVGRLTGIHNSCVQYWVGVLEDLQIIVNHFDKYPLNTEKWSDFQLFKQAMSIVKSKEHLTLEGLKKIISIKAALNNGLSDNLSRAFPDIVPAQRPQVQSKRIPDPHWISGFVDAEGCFSLRFIKTSGGESLGFTFTVTQHTRDEELLKSLIPIFGCGRYRIRSSSPIHGDYVVSNFEEIKRNIIPFFDKYPLQGVKNEDFLDFKKALQLKKNTYTSLTKETLVKIKEIKSGMNKGRLRTWGEGVNKTLLNSGASSRPSNKIPSMENKRHHSTISILNKEYLNKEHLNQEHLNQEHLKSDQIKFNQWLAGLIDGDGQFKTTKKGFSSLKIVMGLKDKYPLYEIKHKYGGSVKEIAGSSALKYKLSHPKGLIKLIKDVEGLIRNPIRMLQLNRICVKFNLKLKEPQPLTYNNGWFSGLVDSDGSIYIDEKLGQLTISVTQKNKYLFESLQNLYGGKIDILSSKDAFQYSIYRKDEILKLVEVYFKENSLKSSKASKINLIKEFYTLREYRHLNVNEINKFNEWVIFKNKWEKF